MVQMKIDFHIHTYHSCDSVMRPGRILKAARKKGLDGIVVCDHDTIRGGLEVKEANKDKNFKVIVGAEIKTNAGDITGIFLAREIKSRELKEVIREIREQNGKVILNHPFKGHDLSKIDMSEVDFIEGYNSRLTEEENRKAVELALIHNKPIVAGSDAHLYAEIGNSFTIIENFNSLIPLNHEWRPSKHIYKTISQYIKSFKEKNFRIFVSATAVQLKHSVRKVTERVKDSFPLRKAT